MSTADCTTWGRVLAPVTTTSNRKPEPISGDGVRALVQVHSREVDEHGEGPGVFATGRVLAVGSHNAGAAPGASMASDTS